MHIVLWFTNEMLVIYLGVFIFKISFHTWLTPKIKIYTSMFSATKPTLTFCSYIFYCFQGHNARKWKLLFYVHEQPVEYKMPQNLPRLLRLAIKLANSKLLDDRTLRAHYLTPDFTLCGGFFQNYLHSVCWLILFNISEYKFTIITISQFALIF